MNTLKVKSFSRPATGPYSVGQFKAEAREVIITAIKQRKHLIAADRSFLVISPQLSSMMETGLNCHSWATSKIARFLINNRNLILDIVPPTNPPLIERVKRLAEIAENFKDYEPQ